MTMLYAKWYIGIHIWSITLFFDNKETNYEIERSASNTYNLPKIWSFYLKKYEIYDDSKFEKKNAPYDLSGAITHVRRHDFWDNIVVPDPWDVVLYDEMLKQSPRGGEGFLPWLPVYY